MYSQKCLQTYDLCINSHMYLGIPNLNELQLIYFSFFKFKRGLEVNFYNTMLSSENKSKSKVKNFVNQFEIKKKLFNDETYLTYLSLEQK